MTKGRLIKAIEAFDLNGQGVERVRQAAERGELQCGSACRCLLATAWMEDGYLTIVDTTLVRRCLVGTGSIKEVFRKSHECGDVIQWFDRYDDDEEGNRAVLELLND